MQSERLSTLDEYGNRRFVIPAEVTGPLRTWRTRVYYVLIVFFLLLPWIKINGNQAFLFDIPGRRFGFFGKLFFAHDGPMLFLFLAATVLGLAAITAYWGRIWCGWACPQTVFIDAVYRKIEIWLEGTYIERRRLRMGPWTTKRFLLSSTKWFLFFVVSSIIAHSFFAFVIGADRLIGMIQGSPEENRGYFILISSATAILMFNFGWFREQFCTIMCPYGRFQSVLMDEKSITVLYDEKRGDCVQCNRCVEVCPAKIDIRNGVQMECIACTACIDACNLIMRKVHKPENLIQYQNQAGTGFTFKNPRAHIYSFLSILAAITFLVLVVRHKPFDVTLLRAKDSPYQEVQNNRIVNHFKAHLFNQSGQMQTFKIMPNPSEIQKGLSVTQAVPEIKVPPGQSVETHLFLEFPKSDLDTHGNVQFKMNVQVDDQDATTLDVNAVGPIPNNSAEPRPESAQ